MLKVTEPKFWDLLQSRVSRELAGLEEAPRLGLWCDGFVPNLYALDSPPPQIKGFVWIGIGPREHEKWEFTLVLKDTVTDRADIDWLELIPAENLTSWMKADPVGRRMAIEPGAGSPVGT